MTTLQNTLDWLRLYRSENVGPATFFRLIDHYGTAAKALDALPDMAGRGGKRKIALYPKDAAEKELAALQRLGATLLTAEDANFPEALRALEVVPLLTVMGDPTLLIRPSVGIVGGRDASLNGRKIAYGMGDDLGAAGFVVVSGLARGIDTAAHQGALPTGTVAVLAGGVDHIYPPESGRLHADIAQQGCLVSEMPPGFSPTAQHFPRRNRIIAGLAQGVVVIEAKVRSGSLITARFALEQGRELFAVPGSPLDPRSAGCNALIKQGAQLVETAEDVVSALNLLPGLPAGPRMKPAPTAVEDSKSLSDAHNSVLKLLNVTAVTVDEILRECQLSPSILSLVLLELELAGRLERHPDMSVSLRA
jgi:DNA processing protein